MAKAIVVTSSGRQITEDVLLAKSDEMARNPDLADSAMTLRRFNVSNPRGAERANEVTIVEAVRMGAPLAIGGILAALTLDIGEAFENEVVRVERVSDKQVH